MYGPSGAYGASGPYGASVGGRGGTSLPRAARRKAKAIVTGRAIRKAADISRKAIEGAVIKESPWSRETALVPLDVAAMLTDPCGVVHYNNRREQASEYRPFYADELSTLQGQLNTVKVSLDGLARAIAQNYEETKDKIGFHKDEAMEMIRAVRFGGGGGDLQKAHDFVYGDGVYWEPLEDIINWAAGDIRSDLKEAISAVFATEREAGKLLRSIDDLYKKVFAAYGKANGILGSLVHWNGNALKLAKNFCSETNGSNAYMNKREQQFRGVTDSEWRSGFGYDRPKFWRPFNEPCDKWCRDHNTRTDCQIWPSMYDDAHEAKIKDRTRGMWPAYPTYRGCVKNSAGTYTCGVMPNAGVRSFVAYATSTLPDEAEALLNYDADALFAESKTVMTAARNAIRKVTNLLNGFKNTLNSSGMDATIGTVAGLFCGIGAPGCYSTLSGYRNQAVRGLGNAATQTNGLRNQLTHSIGQHRSAKAMWKSPTTPWRIQANAYLTTLRNLNGPIQSPWTNAASVAACQAIFPEVPTSCLDKLTPASCGRIDISLPPGPKVIDSDMRVFWEGDSGSGREGGLVGSGKPILEKATDGFGSIAPTQGQAWWKAPVLGFPLWQIALVGGAGFWYYKRKK